MITMILLILLLEALYLLYVRGVNMAEPIEIVIRKTQETSTQGTATKGGEKTPKKDENTTQKAIKTALVSAGKNMASYGASQYGNITGNTIAQRQIDNALNIAGYVGQIAAGGWVGAIAVGVQLTTQALNTSIATRKANQQAELLYQRSGNITIDGGRGTYD